SRDEPYRHAAVARRHDDEAGVDPLLGAEGARPRPTPGEVHVARAEVQRADSVRVLRAPRVGEALRERLDERLRRGRPLVGERDGHAVADGAEPERPGWRRLQTLEVGLDAVGG